MLKGVGVSRRVLSYSGIGDVPLWTVAIEEDSPLVYCSMGLV
jgi:hypothetical protein